MRRFLLVAAMIGLGTGLQATPTFVTVPANGVASGEPGMTVGWGFTITNDTPFFLLINDSAFCGPGGNPDINSCAAPFDGVTNFGPSLGTYTDFIANNFTVITPSGGSLTETFDGTFQTGVGAYAIDPSVPMFSTDIGNLFIHYSEWVGNPLTTGHDSGNGTFTLSAPAEVAVTPEPGTWGMAAGALALIGAWRRRRAR